MAPSNRPRETRSRQACDSCRRKKTRCPGEKPACSSCTRLGQTCTYREANRQARGSRAMEDRLAQLEARLDYMARDSTHGSETNITSDGFDLATSDFHLPAQDDSTTPSSAHTPSTSMLKVALQIYFERCHRQPIWCFDLHEIGDYDSISDEVALAILALASHWNDSENVSYHTNLSNARNLVMSRLAEGAVRLSTIEALCFIAQSCFIAGELSLGRFHLSLGLQLCRAASMDVASGYQNKSKLDERKKRLFWSLQMLVYYHGQPTGVADALEQVSQAGDDEELYTRQRLARALPSIPYENPHDPNSMERGIWSILMQLACVWSKARTFVVTCALDEVQEPWRPDSMYTETYCDLVAIESKTPMCHRWQTVKFYDHDRAEVERNGQYWKPWLSTQITYHVVHAIMNHPFLYMAAAQNNKKLAALNTFWTRSSQLCLLHATWIVRVTEMMMDRQMLLGDPIFGQAAAIAATIHLYYLSASSPRMKHKSAADLAKSKAFLEAYKTCSPLFAALDERLEKLLKAALGTYPTSFEGDRPQLISLNARLMWELLELACSTSMAPTAGNGLLHWTLASVEPPQNLNEVVFEVGCAVSPDVNIDTADGGQTAPMVISTTSVAPLRYAGLPNPTGAQTVTTDALATNNSSGSWLWHGAQADMNMHSYDLQSQALGDMENPFWWDFGNL